MGKPGRSKGFINQKFFDKYRNNAHAKENARLRQELANLQGEHEALKLDHKIAKSEKKMSDHTAKKTEAFTKNWEKKATSATTRKPKPNAKKAK